PGAVVHRLEVVDIEKHHHYAITVSGALQCHLDALPEQRAIREVREWIVRCLMRESFFERLACAYVLHHCDDAERLAAGCAVCARHRQRGPYDLAIAASIALLDRELRTCAARDRGHRCGESVGVIV